MKRTCIHPRKAMWAMRDFLNTISPLTHLDGWLVANPNDPIEKWVKGDPVYEKTAIKLKFDSEEGFGALIPWESEELENMKEVTITYDFDSLGCYGDKCFRKNFVKRYPGGNGFASITLSLLHELGHFCTCADFDFTYKMNKILREFERINKLPAEERNEAYFALPDEYAATQWAIEWLQEAEHRKIAKAFEKKFFACFAK